MKAKEFNKIKDLFGSISSVRFSKIIRMTHITVYKFEKEGTTKKTNIILLNLIANYSEDEMLDFSNELITPDEFKNIRLSLGYETPISFATALDRTHKNIYNIESGDSTLTAAMSLMMRLIKKADDHQLSELGILNREVKTLKVKLSCDSVIHICNKRYKVTKRFLKLNRYPMESDKQDGRFTKCKLIK